MKSFIAILAIAVVLVDKTVAQRNCACSEVTNEAFVRSHTSCGHWFRCSGGVAVAEGRCEAGYDFDANRQTCRYIGLVDCFQCSPTGVQNIPSYQGCDVYIQCIQGVALERQCPTGQQFNPTVAQCQPNYQCTIPQTTPCPTLPGDWTTNTQPPITTTMSTTTYSTTSTMWTPIPTDSTTLFPTDSTTLFPTDSTTPPPITDTTTPIIPTPTYPTTTEIPIPTPPTPGVQCNGSQIYLSDPTDCTRYFICINYKPESHECPSGLHWNQYKNSCDFPENANCSLKE